MSWNVIILPKAESGWQDIRDWLRARNPQAEWRIAQHFFQAIEQVRQFPFTGQRFETSRQLSGYPIRRIFFGRQRQFGIYYLVEEKTRTVQIITFSRTSRNVSKIIRSQLS